MWESIKGYLFYLLKWFLLVLLTLLTITIVIGLLVEMPKLMESNEEGIIEEKHTYKGFYFTQFYIVTLSNGKSHNVYKHQFNQLEAGDVYQPFFKKASWKEFLLYTLGLGVFFLMMGWVVYVLVMDLLSEKKWVQAFEVKRKKVATWIASKFEVSEEGKKKWKQRVLFLLIISIMIPFLLIGKNMLVKINPIGKQYALATIQDREVYDNYSFRSGSGPIYRLTYTFEDTNNSTYKTTKEVSSYTYEIYKDESYIPIHYRERFPYETFIEIQSWKEIISAVLKWSNITLLIFFSLLWYFIKLYIENWGIPFIRTK